MKRICLLALVLCSSIATNARGAEDHAVPIGAAKVDITPEFPIRLNGYGNRSEPATEIERRIFARALAIGDDTRLAVLVTVETLGVPWSMTEEVAARLAAKVGLPRERLAICATHTHCAPCVAGITPLIFGVELPLEEQAAIANYTLFLTDRIEEVALAAIARRAAGTLAWSRGEVKFASNRRVVENGRWTGFGVSPNAPVDHSLPVLVARDVTGKPLAILVSYACHCTTLGGDFNRVCGDWAGYASEIVEREHPGAVALVAIGCGADANPNPRGELDMAVTHGASVAAEIDRMLPLDAQTLGPPSLCQLERVEIPFDRPPTRADLEARGGDHRSQSIHARANLARLERGEALPETLAYAIQTWSFDDDLVMVFLAGEVVVDYAIRLRHELDPERLWVCAYANDDPCYIASKRVLAEGGYEVLNSMWLYDQPTQLVPAAEDAIIAAVRRLTPANFQTSR